MSTSTGRPRPFLNGVFRTACNYCVSSKRGCTGGQPCEQCEKRGKACVYAKRRKSGPRGRSSGGCRSSKGRSRAKARRESQAATTAAAVGTAEARAAPFDSGASSAQLAQGTSEGEILRGGVAAVGGGGRVSGSGGGKQLLRLNLTRANREVVSGREEGRGDSSRSGPCDGGAVRAASKSIAVGAPQSLEERNSIQQQQQQQQGEHPVATTLEPFGLGPSEEKWVHPPPLAIPLPPPTPISLVTSPAALGDSGSPPTPSTRSPGIAALTLSPIIGGRREESGEGLEGAFTTRDGPIRVKRAFSHSSAGGPCRASSEEPPLATSKCARFSLTPPVLPLSRASPASLVLSTTRPSSLDRRSGDGDGDGDAVPEGPPVRRRSFPLGLPRGSSSSSSCFTSRSSFSSSSSSSPSSCSVGSSPSPREVHGNRPSGTTTEVVPRADCGVMDWTPPLPWSLSRTSIAPVPKESQRQQQQREQQQVQKEDYHQRPEGVLRRHDQQRQQQSQQQQQQQQPLLSKSEPLEQSLRSLLMTDDDEDEELGEPPKHISRTYGGGSTEHAVGVRDDRRQPAAVVSASTGAGMLQRTRSGGSGIDPMVRSSSSSGGKLDRVPFLPTMHARKLSAESPVPPTAATRPTRGGFGGAPGGNARGGCGVGAGGGAGVNGMNGAGLPRADRRTSPMPFPFPLHRRDSEIAKIMMTAATPPSWGGSGSPSQAATGAGALTKGSLAQPLPQQQQQLAAAPPRRSAFPTGSYARGSGGGRDGFGVANALPPTLDCAALANMRTPLTREASLMRAVDPDVDSADAPLDSGHFAGTAESAVMAGTYTSAPAAVNAARLDVSDHSRHPSLLGASHSRDSSVFQQQGDAAWLTEEAGDVLLCGDGGVGGGVGAAENVGGDLAVPVW